MSDFLTVLASRFGDKPALIEDSEWSEPVVVTYRELEEAANRLADALGKLGVGPESKIAWSMPNSVHAVTALHAIRKLGAVEVPMSYMLAPAELFNVLRRSAAEVLLCDGTMVEKFAAAPEATPLQYAVVLGADETQEQGFLAGEAITAAARAEPGPAPAPGSGGTLAYTSGTTGTPKGVVRPRVLDATPVDALLELLGFCSEDVYLTSGPLYHSGQNGFLCHAQSFGQTVVLQRRFDPLDWLRLVDRYRVTTTFTAPTPVRRVCNLPASVKRGFDRSSLRCLVANAAAWSFALKLAYLEDFPADSLWELYGSTELGVNCVLEPRDQRRKPGSCGKPVPFVEVALADDDGRWISQAGVPGLLYIRSPMAFSHYDGGASPSSFVELDGFRTVGDVAYRDDEGFYFICDRLQDTVISGGVNIYPAEVEATLDEHPDVVEAAVFGIPSPEWGETVHAAVVVREGAPVTGDALSEFVKDRIAAYKVPKGFTFVRDLPRTDSGKILKRQLVARLLAGKLGA